MGGIQRKRSGANAFGARSGRDDTTADHQLGSHQPQTQFMVVSIFAADLRSAERRAGLFCANKPDNVGSLFSQVGCLCGEEDVHEVGVRGNSFSLVIEIFLGPQLRNGQAKCNSMSVRAIAWALLLP